MMKIKKAVIPAAGLGTRFLPATKAQAKEMLPIVDKPTIQYIVEEAVASGITDIIIVTGRNKKPIEDHFDRSMELEMELEKAQKAGYAGSGAPYFRNGQYLLCAAERGQRALVMLCLLPITLSAMSPLPFCSAMM